MKTNHFLSVMRWELTYHRPYLVKMLLRIFSIAFLFMMFSNWVVWKSEDGDISQSAIGLWGFIMVLFLLFSGSYIFVDVKKRQQRLDLLMLPASMPVKFLARYLTATIVTILIFVVSFFAADLLQYLLMQVLHRDTAVFVEAHLLSASYQTARFSAVASTDVIPLLATAALAWWYHSLYLLGGVFFRKHGWLWTTLAQILFFNVIVFGLGYMLLATLNGFFPEGFYLEILDGAETWAQVAYFTVMLALTALNYWLSYRIFSRIQFINNKWTNI